VHEKCSEFITIFLGVGKGAGHLLSLMASVTSSKGLAKLLGLLSAGSTHGRSNWAGYGLTYIGRLARDLDGLVAATWNLA
jgi:hypothetical protein